MGSRRQRATVTGSTLTAATAPAALPLTSIAHNPRNPRESYDDVTELADSIREIGVLQPIGVVRYEIFLSHFPEHEREVGACEWVALNGNRRLAAARLAGLADIPVQALDHLGREGQFDEAVLVENIHRAALPPLREAEAIRLLVARHGSQAKVAKRLAKTTGFVSQRLALLGLVPELRAALEAGELRLEDARELGRMSPESQVAAAASSPTAQAEPGHAGSNGVYGVNDESTVYAVNGSSPQRRGRQRVPRIELGEVAAVAAQLRTHLSREDLAELSRLLLD